MTTIEEAPSAADPDDAAADLVSSLPRRRRVPAPRAHPFWRFLFPLLVIGAGVGVFLLWRTGTKAVLDSTDGRQVDVVTDPADPGYEVFVDPTPTLLALHVDEGELVGVSAMARTALDDGGAVVLLSADLLVVHDDSGEEQGEVLGAAYAEGGVDRVVTLVESLFGFGFLEVLEVDTAALGGVMGLVEPIPFLLADDLVDDGDDGTEVWLARGRHELSGAEAAEVYAFRNPGEADAGRIERQLDLWEAWLSEIERADDPIAATTPFDDGVAPYLRSLGRGARDIAAPPTEALFFDGVGPPLYVLDEAGTAWLEARALDMVPLPVSTRAASRPSVRLLDGVGDPAGRDRLIADLVAAGAVVTVIGNAESFEVPVTVVAYHQPELAAAAEALAVELGATAILDEDADAPVDLTITLGLDQENG